LIFVGKDNEEKEKDLEELREKEKLAKDEKKKKWVVV